MPAPHVYERIFGPMTAEEALAEAEYFDDIRQQLLPTDPAYATYERNTNLALRYAAHLELGAQAQ